MSQDLSQDRPTRRNKRFGDRTIARAQALQLLFQAEATGRDVEDVLAGDYALEEGPLDPYGEELALGASGMLPAIDDLLERISPNWGLDRMPAVDRNLLRLAIYEMVAIDEVDVAVAIDEAVVLAKASGTDESSRCVNGVLGRVASDLAAGIDLCGEADDELDEADDQVEE
ncbi:MAG: transcription antitermination factor NusB [Atopobiaceae bacterium]|nr:transcription antitermination factor NusB [Atopobiaceae bacterium]